MITNPYDMTPIEKKGNIYFKREDLFEINGVKGAKVKGCFLMVEQAKKEGKKAITTAGSRHSPQINIASHIGDYFNIPVIAHTPTGELFGEVLDAQKKGAKIIQHRPGYNSVIIKRAKDYAIENDCFYIPFGMDCQEAVDATAYQVESLIPYLNEIDRIVMVIGSGINFSGLLKGLKERNINKEVLGVRVGKDPKPILNKYAPKEWEKMCTIIDSGMKYEKHSEFTNINGIEVDEIYEGKCIPFLKENDLFWILGIRKEHEKGKAMNI